MRQAGAVEYWQVAPSVPSECRVDGRITSIHRHDIDELRQQAPFLHTRLKLSRLCRRTQFVSEYCRVLLSIATES